MARPKKINEDIIPLIEEYWIERCDRNPKKLKYSMIANYLGEKELPIKEYDLRRNKEVCSYVKKLKDSIQFNNSNGNKTVIYQSLDINEFLKKHNDIYSLRDALAKRDEYYSEIYDYAITNIKKSQFATEELNKLKVLNNTSEKNIEQLHNENNHLFNENKKLKMQLATMLNVLKVHVYPEIANELLRKNNLLSEGEQIISPDGLENIIKDEYSIVHNIKKNQASINNCSVLKDLFDKI